MNVNKCVVRIANNNLAKSENLRQSTDLIKYACEQLNQIDLNVILIHSTEIRKQRRRRWSSRIDLRCVSDRRQRSHQFAIHCAHAANQFLQQYYSNFSVEMVLFSLPPPLPQQTEPPAESAGRKEFVIIFSDCSTWLILILSLCSTSSVFGSWSSRI